MLLVVFAQPGFILAEKKPVTRFKLLIDPAHGGTDPGVKLGNVYEKDLVLTLAQAIRNELTNQPQLEVHLTRVSDKTMSIEERLELARGINPHLFVSLHVNAGFGKNASGYEVYFPGFQAPVGKEGEPAAIISDMTKNRHLNEAVRFSRTLQRHLEQVFPRKWRDLREAPLVVFRQVNFPVVSLELGFCTNPEDQKKLMEADTKAAFVRAFARSIRDFSL